MEIFEIVPTSMSFECQRKQHQKRNLIYKVIIAKTFLYPSIALILWSHYIIGSQYHRTYICRFLYFLNEFSLLIWRLGYSKFIVQFTFLPYAYFLYILFPFIATTSFAHESEQLSWAIYSLHGFSIPLFIIKLHCV